MLFSGREVLIKKNCALGVCTDLGLWPRAQFFSIRTSRPANIIYLLVHWPFQIEL